jgi:hypothetical protein
MKFNVYNYQYIGDLIYLQFYLVSVRNNPYRMGERALIEYSIRRADGSDG